MTRKSNKTKSIKRKKQNQIKSKLNEINTTQKTDRDRKEEEKRQIDYTKTSFYNYIK